MVRVASMFSQLLQFAPRWEFEALVREHHAEKAAKGFTCWGQFVAMLFCQLAQAKSLREICDGLRCCLGKLTHLGLRKAPPRSTLSYANAHRPWQLFEAVFSLVLARARQYAPRKKFRFKNKLLSLDATFIDLCLSLFPWAEFRRTKGAIKLHLLLDHDGYLPIFANLTTGKVNEIRIAQELELPAQSIITFDMGYLDFALFYRWTTSGIWFVTRLKECTAWRVVQERPLPMRGNRIRADQLIEVTVRLTHKKYPALLRRVVVWDEKEQREIVLLTNHLTFAASTIAAIYKDRWQIELFFKALKQCLKVKTFVGTSLNALKIQIWTALIAILILKILQFRARRGWSLANLVALLHWNLFIYRNLFDWLDDPFLLPPPDPDETQLPLQGLFLGQQTRDPNNDLIRKTSKPVPNR